MDENVTTDAGSLQNLHDIVAPGAVAWWPPAPGWYVVGLLSLLLLVWLAWRQTRQWRKNRYRRQALRELSEIRRHGDDASLREVPELLKRTAVSAWPRAEVASLSGPAWHRFLDESARMSRFTDAAGALLDHFAYAGSEARPLATEDSAQFLDAAEYWLVHHRRAHPLQTRPRQNGEGG